MEIVETKLELDVRATRIPAALTVPDGEAPRWGIILIPGSFFSDLDGNYSRADGNPFEARPNILADLARQLSGLGHAVLRYARAGTTVMDAAEAAALRTFAGRTLVVAAAGEELRRRIPGRVRLAIAGHSEGAAVTLLWLTSDPRPAADAYISLSGPGMRFFDVMIAQSAPNVRDGMITFGEYRFPFELYRRSFDFVRAGKPVPEDIRAVLPPFSVQAMPPAARQYLVDYDRLDPAEAIARVDLPVMIVQGGQDTSVTAENADRLSAARKGKEEVTARAFFPELNHFYKVVPPGTASFANFGLEGETDRRVAEAVSSWLDSLGD